MSTNLVQLGLAWNFVNNSKSVENQKKLQLQKLFNLYFFLHKFFGNFSHPLAIFPWGIQVSVFKFDLENEFSVAHLSVALRMEPGLLVGWHRPPGRNTSPRRSPLTD
jgi:hypothetical protein